MSSDRNKEFDSLMTQQWSAMLSGIFPTGIPSSAQWNLIGDITKQLNIIGDIGHGNHLFLPTGGGLDLTGCQTSAEKDCVNLITGGSHSVVKPKILMFESFGAGILWSYFRLETYELKPSGVYDDHSYEYEELLDLGNGDYRDRSVWDAGYLGYDENGNEKPLPKNSKPICRYFGGSFVIFSQISPYNRDPSTYDARHNKMSATQFREYIQRHA